MRITQIQHSWVNHAPWEDSDTTSCIAHKARNCNRLHQKSCAQPAAVALRVLALRKSEFSCALCCVRVIQQLGLLQLRQSTTRSDQWSHSWSGNIEHTFDLILFWRHPTHMSYNKVSINADTRTQRHFGSYTPSTPPCQSSAFGSDWV